MKQVQRRAAQRDEVLRNAWIYELGSWTANMLVFMDESAANERTKDRKYGWSPVGVPTVITEPLRRSKRWSILPAYTVDGYMSTLILQESITTDIYNAWVRDEVLPHCSPYPGPRSVLIMDNASIHRSAGLRDMCREAGILLRFLPPYSPDFNPIEPSFHLLKAWIKRYRDLAPTPGDEEYTERFVSFLHQAAREFGTREKHKELFQKAFVTME